MSSTNLAAAMTKSSKRRQLAAEQRDSVQEQLRCLILVQAWVRHHQSSVLRLNALVERRLRAEMVVERFWCQRQSQRVTMGQVVQKIQAIARGWVSIKKVYLKVLREHQRVEMAGGVHQTEHSTVALDRIMYRLENGSSSPREDLRIKQHERQNINSDPQGRKNNLLTAVQRRQSQMVGGTRKRSSSPTNEGACVDADGGAVIIKAVRKGEGGRVAQSPLLGSGTASATLFHRVQRKEALKRKLKQQGAMGSIKTQLKLHRSNVVDSPFMVESKHEGSKRSTSHEPPPPGTELPPRPASGQSHTTTLHESGIQGCPTGNSEVSVDDIYEDNGDEDEEHDQSTASRQPNRRASSRASSITSNPFTSSKVLKTSAKEERVAKKAQRQTASERVKEAQRAEIQRFVDLSQQQGPTLPSSHGSSHMRPSSAAPPKGISQTVLLNEMNHLLLETQRCSSATTGRRGVGKGKGAMSTSCNGGATASGLSSYEVLRRAQAIAAMSKSSIDGHNTDHLKDLQDEDWEHGSSQKHLQHHHHHRPATTGGSRADTERPLGMQDSYSYGDETASVVPTPRDPIQRSREQRVRQQHPQGNNSEYHRSTHSAGGRGSSNRPTSAKKPPLRPTSAHSARSEDPDISDGNSESTAGFSQGPAQKVAEEEELLMLLMAGSTLRTVRQLTNLKKHGGRNPGPTKMQLASGPPMKLISQDDGGEHVRPETYVKKVPKQPRGVTIGQKRGHVDPPPTAWPHPFIVVPVAHKI